ncbi:MAG: E3 binding domain-containing protein, partial [Pseudomonas sp.]
MSQTKNFNLPDLGEGLPDATIVEWFVKQGDTVRLDEPLVAMETAKAVVEVPSPVSGRLVRQAGAAGDVIVTGALLAQFELDPNLPQRAEGQDTGHHHHGGGASVGASVGGTSVPTLSRESPVGAEVPPTGVRAAPDAGTVVGAMHSSDTVHAEQAITVGGIKAMPAVRAMARKLGVELSRVRASGADGAVTMADVKRAAADHGSLLPAADAARAPSQREPERTG